MTRCMLPYPHGDDFLFKIQGYTIKPLPGSNQSVRSHFYRIRINFAVHPCITTRYCRSLVYSIWEIAGHVQILLDGTKVLHSFFAYFTQLVRVLSQLEIHASNISVSVIFQILRQFLCRRVTFSPYFAFWEACGFIS